jgi:hypothetical protein
VIDLPTIDSVIGHGETMDYSQAIVAMQVPERIEQSPAGAAPSVQKPHACNGKFTAIGGTTGGTSPQIGRSSR